MRQSVRAASAAMVIVAASGAALAGENRVEQSGRAFEPATLTVSVGDGLTFINSDLYDHNVYSESPGNVFNLGIQTPGQTNGVTLATPGTVDVRCRIHPKMKLIVTVE